MKKNLLGIISLVLILTSCSTPILNNTSQYSDLDKEYSQFTTKALTQSYLKKKMDKWLSDAKYSKNLVREIEYAKFKHKDLLKDIVALQPTMFDNITANTAVITKRVESPFENYIEYINPYPSSVTANNATNITSSSFTANWAASTDADLYSLYVDGTWVGDIGNVTSYNVTGLTASSTHSYYVKAGNVGGRASGASNTINVTLLPVQITDLVAYYPFNGNANDASGYAYNGTLTNATLTTDRKGNANKAYNFAGNAYVDSPFNFNGTLTDFSFSYWVKFNTLTGTQKMFHIQEGAQGGREINNDNINNFNFYMDSITNYSTVPFTTNTWYHIVTSFNKTTQHKKIYVNGVLVVDVASTVTITALPNSVLRIGARLTNIEYLNGALDDFRVYKKELTQSEVSSLYSFND